MTNISTSVDPTQSGTMKASGDVSLVAANHQANAGLLMCAQSGNKEAAGDGSGVQDLADCQDYFKKSDALLKMAQKAGVNGAPHPDEGMLSDPASVSTLEKFQSNFGIDKDEYVRRMLSSHGSRAEFADMLSSKFGEEKLDKLFASAEEAAPTNGGDIASATESTVTLAKKPAANTSLRDSLKAKLEAADANRKLASNDAPKTDYRSIRVPNEKLQPSGLESWMSGSEQDQEASLTIFDVVHQKLQSLKQRERI